MSQAENLQILQTECRDFLKKTRHIVARAAVWSGPVMLFVIACAAFIFLIIQPHVVDRVFYVLRQAAAGVPDGLRYVLPLIFILAGAWFFIKDLFKVRDRMVTTFPSKVMGAFLKKIVHYDFRVLHALRDRQENVSMHYSKYVRRVEAALSIGWFVLALLSEKLLLENMFFMDTVFHLRLMIALVVLGMLMLLAVDLFFEALFYMPRLIRVFVVMAIAMKESDTRLTKLFQEQKTE